MHATTAIAANIYGQLPYAQALDFFPKMAYLFVNIGNILPSK